MSFLKRIFSRSRNFKRLKRETEGQRLVAILDRAGVDTFLDVGANTGQTGEQLRRFGYAGNIISYEPLKACHDELVQKSADDSKWTIAPRCALGAENGSVEINVSEGSSLSSISAPTEAMSSAMPKVRAEARESVPLHRLDHALKDEIEGLGRAFLKVDAQGYDMEVLKGAEGLMDALAGVKVEMSLFPLYEGETLYLDMLQYLHKQGFRPHLLSDVGFSKKLGRQLQIDGVFVRES